MSKLASITIVLTLLCASTHAQSPVEPNSKRLRIGIEYGQQLGIQHQVLGTRTTQDEATGETTNIENISWSLGCGMSPGIAVDYSLTKNIQVGFAGDYVFGRTITTNELKRGSTSSKTTAALRAMRIAPRLSLTTPISTKVDLFARVGVDLVFMAKLKEEAEISLSMFEDLLPDPSMFPDMAGGITATWTTTGKFAPGIAFQTGVHYRINERFGLQVAIEYRGYNFTTKHTEIEIDDPTGYLGLLSAVPFISQTDYVESLGNTSNNETMRDPEDLNLFAPRQALEQKKPASSLGLRVGFSIWL